MTYAVFKSHTSFLVSYGKKLKQTNPVREDLVVQEVQDRDRAQATIKGLSC